VPCLPRYANTPLFPGPQPAFNSKPSGEPEERETNTKTQRFWVLPDKTGASSRGLAPIGSEPEDKQMLSALGLHPPTTHTSAGGSKQPRIRLLCTEISPNKPQEKESGRGSAERGSPHELLMVHRHFKAHRVTRSGTKSCMGLHSLSSWASQLPS